jgi:hypothetical protein
MGPGDGLIDDLDLETLVLRLGGVLVISPDE